MAKFMNRNVNNGVTGTFISARICAIIFTFWTNNISPLLQAQKLEIGCTILFGMIAANSQTKKIISYYSQSDSNKIEVLSIKFIDMIGWVIRSLMKDNINLYASLQKLGVFHQNIGVKYETCQPMLQSMFVFT
eukprot:UN06593